jgi:hypothetical protein
MPIRVHKVADIVDRAVVFCGTWKSCNGDAAAIINGQPAADPIPGEGPAVRRIPIDL